ncbi:MAG: hypothetical protein R2851_23660 [Caldilineaceae bacterium]
MFSHRSSTLRRLAPGLLTVLLATAVLCAGCTLPTTPANLVNAVATLTATTPPSATSTAAPTATPTAVSVAGDAVEVAAAPADPTAERDVWPIPLDAPANVAEQEYSAMAWYGDTLVLVPQFPARDDNALVTLARADVLAYLRGELDGPLPTGRIPFDDGNLAERITGFEGYEAIGFDGDTVYMTVETHPGTWMLGYIVAGTIDADGITLDPALRTPVAVQAPLSNMTDETLVIDGDRVLTIFEANGVNVNPAAHVNVFSRDLEKLEPIPLANVEYRLTDATALDDARRFWAINYFWPGDDKLKPADDPIAATYGQGKTHAQGTVVERLLEFQVADDGVTLTETPPIQLTLLPAGVARNWEGIARLQDGDIDGFLLVTDKFPVTQLAFVAR